MNKKISHPTDISTQYQSLDKFKFPTEPKEERGKFFDYQSLINNQINNQIKKN